MTTKQLDTIQGAILSSFVAQHYISEVLKLKLPFVKHQLKKSLKDAYKGLEVIEHQYFDSIDDIDESELNHKLTSNTMDFLEMLTKDSYSDFIQFQQMYQAFKIDKEKMEKISHEILTNEN
jgi:hypothetical protein